MIIAIAVWAQIQLGAVVRPETVTVGDHFSMVVRVRAPQGSTITFPVSPDSGASADTAGPTVRRDTSGADFTESEVTYTLAAWEIGPRAIGLGDVVITGPLGERHISLAHDSIYVRSVLPADTALRKPKQLRPLIPVHAFNWLPWLIAALAALALMGGWRLWVWWRRRLAAPVDPMTWAEREFRRVESMGLLDTPHPEHHAVLMAEVLRQYLVRRFGPVRLSATTRQLAATLQAEPLVPADRVIALLERIDLLKFARATLARASAESVGGEARAIVRDIEARAQAAAAATRGAGGMTVAQWSVVQFVMPYALLLLLLLPVWWIVRARRRPPAITFSRTETLAQGPKAGAFIPTLLFVLRNLVLMGLIVALARPRLRGHVENVTSEGINIVLTIDLSSSMLAEDFQPQNRLEVAKETVKRFIVARTSDRIGVVAFAGEALTQVPLTTDYPVVLQAVDNLQAGQLDDGTAIGDAIATAANRLRSAPGKSRVMILLTDGVNNRGNIDPRTAAQAAAAFGIKIYTVGVGTEGMAPVPVGRGVYGLRFEMQPVEIDEALLTSISRMTGGRYFRARDAAALRRIYEQIDQLERTRFASTTYVRYSELFRWSLGVAMLALLLELGIGAVRAPLP